MLFNYSILSYNKIEEIDEQRPISTPTSSSSENNEGKEKFYYSFELQSKYNIEDSNLNSSRAYSSPSLFLWTNNNNNIISNKKNNNIIGNKNNENGKKIKDIFIPSSNTKSSNMNSTESKKKNIINLYKQKNNINQFKKENYNNNLIKPKKILYEKKIITGDNNINRNKNKNSISLIKRVDTTKSNVTVKNENFKDRVEFDNKTQKYNIYINNNIFNYKVNNKIISIMENNNNENISNDNKIKNNVKKKNLKITINDGINKKKFIENYISSIHSNKKDNINIKNNTIKKINDDKTKSIFNKDILENKKINSNSKNKIKNINFNFNFNYNNYNKSKKTNKNVKNIDNNTLRSTTKTNIISLKLSQFQRIIKKNGLFNILKFLDNKDLINILETKNKKLKLLINKSIFNAYHFIIKQNLQKYNEFFEVLKYTLVFSKIKNLLKIDITISIRFIDKNNKITPFNPRHFQLIYLYEYLNNKESMNNKLYDCYSFDLYSNKKELTNIINKEFNGIYLSQQITMFGIDKNDEIINIQPILPFKINDKGIFNLEIYSTNNCFINPSNLIIKVKSKDLNKNIKDLENKNINNLRINEYEYICKYWQNINHIIENEDNKNKKIMQNQIQNLLTIKNIIKIWFEPYFIIKDIYFENIGLTVYKVFLIANVCGLLINNKLNIKIHIKDNDDYIENEIKKNNLLFEKRGIFEIRKGENIIFYLSMAEIKI